MIDKIKVVCVVCGMCNGTGQDREWGEHKGTKQQTYTLKDCGSCGGRGKVDVTIIDNRVVAKKKRIRLPDTY